MSEVGKSRGGWDWNHATEQLKEHSWSKWYRNAVIHAQMTEQGEQVSEGRKEWVVEFRCPQCILEDHAVGCCPFNPTLYVHPSYVPDVSVPLNKCCAWHLSCQKDISEQWHLQTTLWFILHIKDISEQWHLQTTLIYPTHQPGVYHQWLRKGFFHCWITWRKQSVLLWQVSAVV